MNTYTQYDLYQYLPDRNIYIYMLYIYGKFRKSAMVRSKYKAKKQTLGHCMRKKEMFEGFVRSYYSHTNI